MTVDLTEVPTEALLAEMDRRTRAAAPPKTLLLSWDRSADQRGNCVCTFIVDALVTPEQALAIARESFPLVFQRIEQHLGREPRLAGPVPT